MPKFNAQQLIQSGWNPSTIRPEDNALVAYLFEPFMGIYGGYYDAKTDSVAGASGFTSWAPEVLCWAYLPMQ